MKRMSNRYLKTNDRLSDNLKAPSPLTGEGKGGGACKFPPPLRPLPPGEGTVIVGQLHEGVLPARQAFSPPLVGGARGGGKEQGAITEAGKGGGEMAGFTLIEVMAAIMILTFGLLAVGSMQISAMRGNFMGGNTSIALSLASEKMEDLLNKPFNDPELVDSATGNNGDLSSYTTVDWDQYLSEEGGVAPGGFYRRIWNIANETSPTRKSVMVIVTWENNRHRVSIGSIKNQIVY